MPQITMYCTEVCRYCNMAERLLETKGIERIDKIRVDLEPQRRDEMVERTGRTTVPQIFIGDTHVGGFDDLHALDSVGKLDQLLAVGES